MTEVLAKKSELEIINAALQKRGKIVLDPSIHERILSKKT